MNWYLEMDGYLQLLLVYLVIGLLLFFVDIVFLKGWKKIMEFFLNKYRLPNSHIPISVMGYFLTFIIGWPLIYIPRIGNKISRRKK
ncbi:hypothetical protein LCGC14_0738800 [marine sediment metagenome]|uniref:Uncharacterized protein n=1 Tax=marine sediment metagenome TaxID=412755 RepID=A0A0F9Q7D1_9ZZZZ